MPESMPVGAPDRERLESFTDEVGYRASAPGHRSTAPGSASDAPHGYRTDETSLGLRIDLLHGAALGWEATRSSVARGLQFLGDAYDDDAGRFRGFRAADGGWLDAPGSDDTNGYAMHALGLVIADCPDDAMRDIARGLFERALPTASGVSGLRARASLLLACDAAERGGLDGETARVYQAVGNALRQSFEVRDVTFDWPWPEPVLSGRNGLPAHALIVGGTRLGYPRMLRMGLRAVEWLLTVQTSDDGHLSLIGDVGGWTRGGSRATTDQRPVEATTLLLAADAAWRSTGTPRFRVGMEAAYAWYLGANDVLAPVADFGSGACHDGIGAAGLLPGQGVEATLMWLIAVEAMRAHRTPAPEHPKEHPNAEAVVTGSLR